MSDIYTYKKLSDIFRTCKNAFKLLKIYFYTSNSMKILGEKFPSLPIEGIHMLTFNRLFRDFNSDLLKTIEMPSGNAFASARGRLVLTSIMLNPI